MSATLTTAVCCFVAGCTCCFIAMAIYVTRRLDALGRRVDESAARMARLIGEVTR